MEFNSEIYPKVGSCKNAMRWHLFSLRQRQTPTTTTMRSYAAALTALALAHDAAAFKVPVSSRTIHTTVRAQFARVRTL